jgi:hypothetical protein
MSFSSMNEAFNTSMVKQPTNRYKQPDVFEQISQNTSTQQSYKPYNGYAASHNNGVSDGDVNEYREYMTIPTERKQPKEDREHDFTCKDIVNHVMQCEYCKYKLRKRGFGKPTSGIPEHLQNTFVYLIAMIFLLFLLDLFVKIVVKYVK